MLSDVKAKKPHPHNEEQHSSLTDTINFKARRILRAQLYIWADTEPTELRQS